MTETGIINFQWGSVRPDFPFVGAFIIEMHFVFAATQFLESYSANTSIVLRDASSGRPLVNAVFPAGLNRMPNVQFSFVKNLGLAIQSYSSGKAASDSLKVGFGIQLAGFNGLASGVFWYMFQISESKD